MFETVVFVSVLIGIVFVFIAFIAMLVMRGKRADDDAVDSDDTSLQEIDAASDAALDEINNVSRLVLDEINEKYQALLFLYSLLDEKKKEITELVNTTPAVPRAKTVPSDRVTQLRPPVTPVNIKYTRIGELHAEGFSVAEIAQKLDMGQGEVKLILDLSLNGGKRT